MQKFLHIPYEQTQKNKIKILLPKNKFKMAAKFKMGKFKRAKIKFACENYKLSLKTKSGLFQLPKYLSFIEKKFSKIQDGAYIHHKDFFCQIFLEALIFVRNFKMVKFLHILKEKTKFYF
jgi:hypothetical protein